MTQEINLYTEAGNTFSYDLQVLDDSGAPLDLTGYTIRASLKKDYDSTTVTNFIIATRDLTTGKISLQLSSSQTYAAPFVVTGSIWSALTMIGIYSPNLTIVQLGVNDARTSVGASTYQSNLNTIVQKALQYGDVLLMDFLPDQNVATALQQPYLDAARAVAIANNVPLASISERWGSQFSVGSGLGYYYDAVHMLPLGYCAEADWLSNIILGI